MVKCNLSTKMGERKLKIADVAKDLDLNRSTITLLYYEKAVRIDFEVLEKLCRYFNCSIGDLLEVKD